MSAFVLLALSLAVHHLTSLTGPGYLAIIVLGELVDRLDRILGALGTRKTDS